MIIKNLNTNINTQKRESRWSNYYDGFQEFACSEEEANFNN